MRQKIKDAVLPLSLLAAMLFLICFPKHTASAVKESLSLCAATILPAMFPYLLFTDLFITSGCADRLARRMQKIMPLLFSVSGAGATPLLIGLVGGYPMGAKAIADLYAGKRISKDEAEALSGFCCNAGPGFIIGVLGGTLYRSIPIGLTLYAIHIVSAILCGLLTRRPLKISSHHSNQNHTSLTNAIVHAAESAATVSLKITSFIVTFSILISALKLPFAPDSTPFCILSGLLEISSGCLSLSASTLIWPIKFALTAGFISFGGACVLFQTMSVFSEVSIKIRSYLTGKILQGLISVVLAYPFSFLFSPNIEASAFPITLHPTSPFPDFLLPILLLAILLHFSSRNPQHIRL